MSHFPNLANVAPRRSASTRKSTLVNDQEPTVFIIVLTWNGEADTLECLSSFSRLDYPNYYVVVVDNGSSDSTVECVRRQFSTVHLIENGRNLGFAEGNNVGIRYALEHNADYVFLLNNDVIVDREVVARLLQAAQDDSQIGILCPSVQSYIDHTKSYVGGKISWNEGTAAEIESSPDGLPEVLDIDYAPGCALLIKSVVVKAIGLLDPTYFAYYEDVDWSLRCRRKGYRVVVVPKARIYHKGTMDQPGRKSASASFYFWRNQFLFMRKHVRWYHWPSFLKNFTRRLLLRYEDALQRGDQPLGNAMLNGGWAGFVGRFGAQEVKAPQWFTHVIREHLRFWLWLTGWLYFWDYQKVKRRRAKEARVSV